MDNTTSTWAEQAKRLVWEVARAQQNARYDAIKKLMDAGRYAEAEALIRGDR